MGDSIAADQALAALHESGHACAYLHLPPPSRVIIKSLSIADDGTGVCSVRHRFVTDGARATVLFAGLAAECYAQHGTVWTPTAAEVVRLNSTERDIQDAVALLGDDGRALAHAWSIATMLVHNEWEVITAIAQALKDAGTLTGEEVTSLWRVSRRAGG